MAVNWYVDEGLATLIKQWKVKFPNAVVGTIGDASHASRDSEHNPEPAGSLPGEDYGEVDAADFMVGTKAGQPTKADLQDLRDALVEARDARLWFVIWNHKITSSTTQPWVERDYSGSDPHIGHVHVSVNDKFDKNTATWDIEDEQMKFTMTPLPKASLPTLKYGMDDAAYEGYNQVHRAQYMLNYTDGGKTADLDTDGIYGPKMQAKVKARFGGDGKTITATQLAGLLGITGY